MGHPAFLLQMEKQRFKEGHGFSRAIKSHGHSGLLAPEGNSALSSSTSAAKRRFIFHGWQRRSRTSRAVSLQSRPDRSACHQLTNREGLPLAKGLLRKEGGTCESRANKPLSRSG